MRGWLKSEISHVTLKEMTKVRYETMRCPNCGDDRCIIIEETETQQKGFGFFKGCCGYIILGPIGWICGLCGMGKGHTSRRAFWVCPHCGKKFRM